MNMQKKPVHNTVFSPPDDWFTASSWAEITDSLDFHQFHEIPRKGWTPVKIQTPGQERIWTQDEKIKKWLKMVVFPPANPY